MVEHLIKKQIFHVPPLPLPGFCMKILLETQMMCNFMIIQAVKECSQTFKHNFSSIVMSGPGLAGVNFSES